ncbi:M20/M25/M40 family metallo-hydrolase [Sphingomonas sp. DG1-23]|uniref:M28 family metallopeptidase n=1 Tax=Sphingomonas sp. DG1-23 TaxID=3068316 RepID=UPI00273FFE46|nr:M20/M25/M40 family metallo-hydrolase [Sphingomonas sp. DG1-23]MDP5281146.1 M20/M25/M40 family metallo-hydrolase [Sphingomonas sp. DG1-23]
MHKLKTLLLAGALATGLAAPASAQRAPARITPEHVRAHVDILAGPGLRGRGSATPDEAAAAAYVAAMFRGYGLAPAPGMTGYTQPVDLVSMRLDGAPVLTANGAPVAAPLLFSSTGQPVRGKLAVYAGTDPRAVPAADAVIVTGAGVNGLQFAGGVDPTKVKLVILRANAQLREYYDRIGGRPRLPRTIKGETPRLRPTVVALDDAAFDKLAAQDGAQIALELPGLVEQAQVTTNALGYIPGTDPAAGVLLVSAHLDHLGVRPDGKVMYGANDDASGTAAVLELARSLVGKKHRRGILFVAYGSEEAGGFGARWFAEHPPVPLGEMVANLEIEMIGQQDPKLPAGTMMMTGYERSTFGETLKAHGALVTTDPYPEQNFFQRSDNYALALKGVVAHTVSGWATVPTYHTPEDVIERLDLPFMARAIQSLVAPLASLANSKARPEWKPGGRPTE